MKKEDKFLLELEQKLKGLKKKDIDNIISKYENIILDEKTKKKKINAILKSLGDINSIVEKEKEELSKNKVKLKERFKELINSVKEKLMNINLNNKNTSKYLRKKTKKISKKINIKNNINTKKLNINIKEKISSFFKKFKKKKNIKEIIEDVPSEALNEITQSVTEKKIFETKKQRIFRVTKITLGILFILICVFALLWSIVILMATVFSLLDGLKIYGVVLAIFGLVLFLMWFITIIYCLIFKLKINKKLVLVFMFLIIFIIAGGVAYTFRQYEKIESVHDVTTKYNLTTFTEKYKLPNRDRTLYITFNSIYNTDYVVEFDPSLKDEVKIQVQYYENYYDFYVKKGTTNIYLSLKEDTKDMVSAFIDDLKESKIFNLDEFKRYSVKIIINEKYKDRIVIHK